VLKVALDTILVILVTYFSSLSHFFIILQWLSKVAGHVAPYQPYLSIFFLYIFELCLLLNRANILLAGQKAINQSINLQLQGMVQKS
jgi:hypothetical protein